MHGALNSIDEVNRSRLESHGFQDTEVSRHRVGCESQQYLALFCHRYMAHPVQCPILFPDRKTSIAVPGEGAPLAVLGTHAHSAERGAASADHVCFVNFKSAISALRIRPRGLGFLPCWRLVYFMRAFLTR